MRDIRASVEVPAHIGAAGMGVVGGDLTHRRHRERAWGTGPLRRHTGKSRHRVGAEREVGNDE